MRVEPDFRAAVERVVGRLNSGEVVSYGDVAAEAGYPGAARAVGRVMATSDGLPWWRVVMHDGRLAPGKEVDQGRRLRAEGVDVQGGRVVTFRRSGRGAPRAGEARIRRAASGSGSSH